MILWRLRRPWFAALLVIGARKWVTLAHFWSTGLNYSRSISWPPGTCAAAEFTNKCCFLLSSLLFKINFFPKSIVIAAFAISISGYNQFALCRYSLENPSRLCFYGRAAQSWILWYVAWWCKCHVAVRRARTGLDSPGLASQGIRNNEGQPLYGVVLGRITRLDRGMRLWIVRNARIPLECRVPSGPTSQLQPRTCVKLLIPSTGFYRRSLPRIRATHVL